MFVQIDHYEHSVKLPEYRDAKVSALIILVYIVFFFFMILRCAKSTFLMQLNHKAYLYKFTLASSMSMLRRCVRRHPKFQ